MNDGSDTEIFLYNGTTTVQLTDNSHDDYSSQINNMGLVVWDGYDGSDTEIFLYDGHTTIQLTDNAYDDVNPQINDEGLVAWLGYEGSDYEIFLNDGSTTIQLTDRLTDDPYGNSDIQINDKGQVVWTRYIGNVYWYAGKYLSDTEVFFYDGTETNQLTEDNPIANWYKPGINDNGQVVWSGSNDNFGGGSEIFLYDGSSTIQLTDSAPYSNWNPQINNTGQVVWYGDTGTLPEIFLYDGSTTSQLTHNTYWEGYPQINDKGQVAWKGAKSIYLYDGSTTLQFTDNSYAVFPPQINNREQVVWQSDFGLAYEIMLASPCTDYDGDGFYAEGGSCGTKDCDDFDTLIGTTKTFYHDSDNDGSGNPYDHIQACTAPEGYISDNTDCDDNNKLIFPGAIEICNAKDDDCDGITDEHVVLKYYKDADSDWYGDEKNPETGCSAPSGYVLDNTDCDDTNASVYPGATEICNTLDDNCDGTVDENLTTTYYLDSDSDGYGNISFPKVACSEPEGYASNSTDCEDSDAAISPAAAEICSDSMDNDCDGLSDCADVNCSKEPLCASDIDGDGVPDTEEMGPYGTDSSYDGNNDGTPDHEQSNITSCKTQDGNHYVTFECDEALSNVAAIPTPPDAPTDIAFPYGFFEFTISGITPGSSCSVTLIGDGEQFDSYYKYGRTPADSSVHWYEFQDDGQTGAEINGFEIFLYFVDGKRGDDDIAVNGTISDQGGPGIKTCSLPLPPASSSGGCSIVGTKLSISVDLAGYGFLILAFVWFGIRKRRSEL